MNFARHVFQVAAIYGLAVLVPQYFLEVRTGRDFPPPITHPEYYYGFVGVAVAWQLAFLVIARDPVRYRPLMPVAVVEKAAFGVPGDHPRDLSLRPRGEPAPARAATRGGQGAIRQ